MNEKALHTLEYFKILARLEDCAVTPMGKALCRSMRPLSDPAEIRRALTESEDALTRIYRRGVPGLSGTKDIGASMMRLEVGGSLSIPELLSLSSLLSAAERAYSYGKTDSDNEDDGDSLTPYFSGITPLTQLKREIDRCIISEEEIADDASPGLRSVRRKMARIEEKVHSQLNSLLHSLSPYLQESIITTRGGRYCLPVKLEYRSSVPGMVHDQSGSGSTLFIEPMAVLNLNNELRELEIEEAKEIAAVLKSLSDETAPHRLEILEDLRILTHLDVIFARGSLARSMRAVKPAINTDGRVCLKRARHPLLAAATVVPIDLTLGEDFDQLIITGPNTGGKTVTLKTLGLLTLMGLSGLLIPAEDGSQLAFFREIYADIGDEQSIEQSLSTFSSHMVNIVEILQKADEDSLVLFDELGAGTDPTEGAALATAILMRLHRFGIRTMATTHYSELKVFALSTPGVENAACEFDVESLKPTYRLLIGVPGKSNAFSISQKLGLPDDVISEAKDLLSEEGETFEDLISDLETKRRDVEKEKAELASTQEAIEQLKKTLDERQQKNREKGDAILEEARSEARKILSEAKEYADRTIREMNKLKAGNGVKEMEKSRTELRRQMDKLGAGQKLPDTEPEGRPPKAEELRIGDKVFVRSLNLSGSVSTLPNAKGELFVQMGILRSKVKLSDLRLEQEETVSVEGRSPYAKKKNKGGSGVTAKSMTISPEIILIGKTVDEALPELGKYLDDAYLAHLHQVRVVHGRGTGALKNAVAGYLKKVSYVKSYRPGEFGEGGYGVTVVDFKDN